MTLWEYLVTEKHDVDLGHGHFLDWSRVSNDWWCHNCCGEITHQNKRGETCIARFLVPCPSNPKHTHRITWQFAGTRDVPDLSPSFLCHCGDHGFIKMGKWVPA